MKRIFFIGLAIASVLLTGCSSNQLKIKINNPSGFDRSHEIAEVPCSALEGKVNLGFDEVYVVTNSAGYIIPSQYTYDDKLIFQSGLGVNETAEYIVSAGAPRTYPAQTYGRFIKERKDDFAWENDRVAFRIYGPALVEIDGPSNGMDIWYKRTGNLVIDKWYADDLAGKASYHDDHGEGLDDYKVARTLGAGAMAPYVEGRLWLNENFASQEILENGPLRTTFKLTYKDVEVAGEHFPETRTISIDAGSQLTKITQQYGFKEPVEVAVGFPLRPESPDTYVAEGDILMYEEPATAKASGVFVGLVVPGGVERTTRDTYEIPAGEKGAGTYFHILAVTSYKPGTPVTYYAGYGWDKFGFQTVGEFKTYLENFSQALQNPFVMEYQ